MVQTLCVCGAGTMGSSIAQSAAQHGVYTLLFDLNLQALEKAQQGIIKNLQQLVDRKKIAEAEKASILSRIHFISNKL